MGCLLNFADAFSVNANIAAHNRFGVRSTSSMSRMSMKSELISGMEGVEMVPQSGKRLSVQRLAAVSVVLSTLLSFGCASMAADKGAGTITDKKYELCVSKCVFSETRPPPNGADNERILTTISRTDIIKDCRKT